MCVGVGLLFFICGSLFIGSTGFELLTEVMGHGYYIWRTNSGWPGPHLHQLLKTFAESRVAATARAQGWEAGPGLLGKLMDEVRRAMIVTVAVLLTFNF